MTSRTTTCDSVVLVGHCGADEFLLRNAVSRALPNVQIHMVDDAKGLEKFLRPGVLLLVNRVLEYGFSTDSGIELVRSLTSTNRGVATMLISNFPEAQTAAVDAGALPGFGKKQVYDESTIERLQSACGSSQKAGEIAS